MIKNISFIILGIILSLSITQAWAIYESGSGDAASVVGYGIYNGTLVAVNVDSNGVVQLH